MTVNTVLERTFPDSKRVIHGDIRFLWDKTQETKRPCAGFLGFCEN